MPREALSAHAVSHSESVREEKGATPPQLDITLTRPSVSALVSAWTLIGEESGHGLVSNNAVANKAHQRSQRQDYGGRQRAGVTFVQAR